MQYAEDHAPDADKVITLFTTTFTASVSETEGRLIGTLVDQLLRDRQSDGTRVFTATDDDSLVGAVLFSPLRYTDDPRTVVLLSPMAVATTRHGEGIGQALITHALNVLRAAGTDVAITYGSPIYYGKTGFSPITEDIAAAPLPLSYPHGWIAQSLTTESLTSLQGRPTCVPALNTPDVW